MRDNYKRRPPKYWEKKRDRVFDYVCQEVDKMHMAGNRFMWTHSPEDWDQCYGEKYLGMGVTLIDTLRERNYEYKKAEAIVRLVRHQRHRLDRHHN